MIRYSIIRKFYNPNVSTEVLQQSILFLLQNLRLTVPVEYAFDKEQVKKNNQQQWHRKLLCSVFDISEQLNCLLKNRATRVDSCISHQSPKPMMIAALDTNKKKKNTILQVILFLLHTFTSCTVFCLSVCISSCSSNIYCLELSRRPIPNQYFLCLRNAKV